MDTGELVVGLLVMVIGSGILWFCNLFYKAWKRTERERRLYWLKVDCMISALRNVNHGFGQDFSKAYDTKMEEMMEEIEFVNK